MVISKRLHVEQEVHNITILHNILLTLDANLTHISTSTLRAKLYIVGILDNLSTDKATLEVGVDDTSGLRGLHTTAEGPSSALISTCGEECLQIEKTVCGLDKTAHARLLQAHILQEHLSLLVAIQLSDIGLGRCRHNKHLGTLAGNSCTHSLGVNIARYG